MNKSAKVRFSRYAPRPVTPSSARSSTISRILVALTSVVALAAVTAAITAFCVRRSMGKATGMARGQVQRPPAASLGPAPAMQNIQTVGAGKATYTGVGSVRSVTAAQEGVEDGIPVAVTAWFSYPKDDSVFFEELSSKSALIRKTIAAYFASHTKAELLQKGEETVKNELRSQINSLLTLGEVGAFYFSEYIFLD